jgi:ferredoxin
MARYINVEKVIFPERSGNNKEEYLFTFRKKKEEISAFLNRCEAEKVFEEIREKLGLNYANNLSETDIDEIVAFQNENPKLCFSCQYRMKECERCVLVCESPLERILFHGLLKAGLDPQLQVWIAKNGNMYPRTANFSPKDCLTRPDFYFENEKGRFCFYADGFSFHNKTEGKVSKDRNIDSQLQKFGYYVRRYPGKDIRENLNQVVSEISEIVT